MSSFPDYYALLAVPKDASSDDIRTAYKKESLKTHPDRLSKATPAEKKRATERFQAVADAYYVLSNKKRRADYDALFATRSTNDRSNDPSSSANFFATFTNMFANAAGSSSGGAEGEQPNAEGIFADVFDDLLRPEVERHTPWWSWLGAISGGGVGFIIGNIPGLMVGAFAGNRLGAIRDAKGKSVAAVFSELGGDQKAQVLRALAMKVLGSAASTL